MIRFSTNKKNDFKDLFISIHGQLNHKKKKTKFVLLTCLPPLLETVESRVLAKNVNETQVSKTVFSRLKAANAYQAV